MITIREEMEYVQNYVIIQKMRFADRFLCFFDIEPEAGKMMMPKLIIQPIVENAITHAIDEYGDEPLHIYISARIQGEDVVLSVRDDGVGIPEEKLATILASEPAERGIGLKNVSERILLNFGPSYGVTITSEEDVGTQVEIRMPVMRQEQ